MPTYYSTLSNASYRLRLDVSLSSQDTAANTSTIAWAFYIERLAGTGRYSGNPTSGSATFGGGATGDSATGVSRASYDFRSGVVTLLWGSGSRVITHNTDGTATLRSSAVFTGDGNIGTGSIDTQNWALPTIPRAATSITRNSGTETGSATVLGLSPLVSSFYYVLKYKSPATGTWTLIGPAGGTVGTAWPYSTTIAHGEIPNAGSGSIEFQVTTLDSSGGTQIGSPVETSFTYTVPASVLPTAGAPTWTEGATTTGLSTLTNSGAVFAQGWSKLIPAFSATAGTGATVSTATTAVAGVTGTTTTGVAFANVVTTQGVGSTFTVTVTDSRSRTDTETGTVSPSVHRWSMPTANAGTPVITPTALTQTIALSGLSATTTSFYLSGSQRNVLETRTGYRDLTTAGAWVYGSWTAQSLSTSDGTDNAYAPGSPLTVATGLDPTHEYEVTLQVRDIFGSNAVNYSNGLPYVASSFIVAAQGVLIAFDGNDRVGIKKVPTLGDLDVAGAIYQNNGLAVIDTGDAATTSVAGIVELATDAETQTGTDASRVVTPASLASLTGTTSRRGLLELATTAEAKTGTSTTLVVTPEGLMSRVGGAVKRSSTTRTFTQNAWYLLTTTADWQTALGAQGGAAAFNGTWVAPENGVYFIEAQITFGATINLIVGVKMNDNNANGGGMLMSQSVIGTAAYASASVSGERYLTAGDVLRLAVFPNTYSGSATWNNTSVMQAEAAGYFGFRKVANG